MLRTSICFRNPSILAAARRYASTTTFKSEHDVIVVVDSPYSHEKRASFCRVAQGSGAAGCASALSASLSGADGVVILEKAPSPYPSLPNPRACGWPPDPS